MKVTIADGMKAVCRCDVLMCWCVDLSSSPVSESFLVPSARSSSNSCSSTVTVSPICVVIVCWASARIDWGVNGGGRKGGRKCQCQCQVLLRCTIPMLYVLL
jgi:hypothetical protein